MKLQCSTQRPGSWNLLVVICCGLALAGCGRRNDQQTGKGQVVAHVGDEVITTGELDNELRWAGIPAARQKDPDAIRKVLGDLVQRKFLVRQAMTAKLDREPGVLLDLLRSREQVLATAYLNRAAAAKPPGKADIDSYIADNAQRFANRAIYAVEQIVFPINADSQALVEGSKDSRTLDVINRKLTEAGVPHARQTGALSSTDMPPDLLALMDARKPEDVFFVRAGANGLFFRVTAVEPRPLTGEAAAELARQTLKADAVKAETGVAAFSANMEARYEGDYAAIMGKPNPSPDKKK